MTLTHGTGLLLIGLSIPGCAGDNFNQGLDLEKTPDTATTDTSEADTDTDADADTDTDADADADSDTDADTDFQACPSSWQPVDQSGWSKVFDVEWRGASGSGTIEGLGPASEADTFKYRDSISTTSEGFDVDVLVGCDGSSGEGMYVYQWEGDVTVFMYSTMLMDYYASVVSSPARLYLPSDAEIGNRGTWDYNYTLTVTYQEATSAKIQSGHVDFSGSYVELGFTDIQLFDGTTVEAYLLTNSYTATVQEYTTWTVNGYIEQWWVRGLGLVSEYHTNADTGEVIMTRELAAYSGITPE